MPAVVLLDQRASRSSDDHVEAWLERLNASEELTLPFVRTAGDEMQGVPATAGALLGVVLDAIEDGGWWVGVGIGPVELPLAATARESRGQAFWLARKALTNAKRGRRPTRPVSVTGEGAEIEDLAATLGAVAFILNSRTPSQTEVAVLHREGLSQGEIAERRSTSRQAVGQLLDAAGVDAEAGLRTVALDLAKHVI